MRDEANNEAVLTGRELAVRYGDAYALDGVDIALRRGRISAILGPSGAGKSTLLRAIAGFQPLASGRIEIDGRVLSDAARTVPPEQRRIGIVVQDLALFPHLTALKNVAFGLSGPDREEIALARLQQVGLADRANAYPHELSGGEQQRIALARALAPDPAVILLDEAFSSLDPQLRRALRRETVTLLRASQAAVLMVTHDPEEAMEIANELIVMGEGRVLQQGRPDELYWQPADLTVAQLLGEVNVLSGEVGEGALHTPFGPILHESLRAGAPVRAIIRPSAIALASSERQDGPKIAEIDFLGAATRVVVAAPCGTTVTVQTDGKIPLALGMRVELAFDADRVTFFQTE